MLSNVIAVRFSFGEQEEDAGGSLSRSTTLLGKVRLDAVL